MSIDLATLTPELIPAITRTMRAAGAAIMQHYVNVGDIAVQTKKDRTPVTAADLSAHKILHAGLETLLPGALLLSEEDHIPDLATRRSAEYSWLVDPLDGTREFIDATDEFCINVALLHHDLPVLGLIYSPVNQNLYVGVKGEGAWCEIAGERKALQCRSIDATARRCTLVSSRRRFNDTMLACEERLRQSFADVERMHMGSALKFCAIASGEVDIFPCFGPTSEWDTAAGQALVEAAGGQMFGSDLQPFRYQLGDSMLNGHFYVLADTVSVDWRSILGK